MALYDPDRLQSTGQCLRLASNRIRFSVEKPRPGKQSIGLLHLSIRIHLSFLLSQKTAILMDSGFLWQALLK